MLAASVVVCVFRVHVPMSRSTTRGVLAAAMVSRGCRQGGVSSRCGRVKVGDGPGVDLGPGSAVTGGRTGGLELGVGGLPGSDSQANRPNGPGKLGNWGQRGPDRNLINQAV